MNYHHSEAEIRMGKLLDRVAELDKELEHELSDTIGTVICQYEDRAVKHHGHLILAAIEGTTFAGAGNVSPATADESRLVRLTDPDPAGWKPASGHPAPAEPDAEELRARYSGSMAAS